VGLLDGALGLGAVVLAAATVAVGAPRETPSPVCQEDSSCWVWSTMGDHSRSIVTDKGKRTNAEPCEFSYRHDHGLLAKKSRHMKGDWTALRLCPSPPSLQSAIDADGANDHHL
jgi:hypothetical protein